MLFATPKLDAAMERRLDEIDAIRRRLGAAASRPVRWLGPLRREFRAADVGSSTAIEGFTVPHSEISALLNGRAHVDPADTDRMAVACYAHAMDHVVALTDDDAFAWNPRLILDLHFDACSFQTRTRPGRWRRVGIGVTRAGGGLAFEGPPPEDVPRLMDEVAAWLAEGDGSHPVVRAAMAHLHVVTVHPFEDGNGRVSRIVQSLVLAREGLLAPELSSIEEYLGEHTADYYDALQRVRTGYQPENDATPWVAFCLDAHIAQGTRRLRQIEDAAHRWDALEELVAERGWPDRFAIALEQSLFGVADRAAYAGEADVSAATATADFRRLLDAGLLTTLGRGRNTRYRASEALRGRISG